jgi:hypothetical protein
MRAVIGKTTTQNVKVTNTGSGLQSSTPITLKNQVAEIRSIEDIADVSEINVTGGSTLIYNSTTDKYEVRLLEAQDIQGALNLDGGEF